MLAQLALMALAASALATTVTKSSIFAGVRQRWPVSQLTCSYCALHWSAAFVVGLCAPALLTPTPLAGLVNIALTWLAVIALGAVVNGVILFLTPFHPDDED